MKLKQQKYNKGYVMKSLLNILLLLSLLLTFSALAVKEHQDPIVIFETNLGNILIAIKSKQAPNTAEYFLSLIDEGNFNGTSFFRSGTTKKEGESQFVEGGLVGEFILNGHLTSMKETNLPMLANYDSTGDSKLRHQLGTVSMGRDLLETGHVVPDIFICLDDIPSFDENLIVNPDSRGFPAFAKVIEGMDIVKKIASQERKGTTHIPFLQGQILTNPVTILRAYRSESN
jgi:peptidyl-prolyl cis-trans isomerase A (cyclophilin A)